MALIQCTECSKNISSEAPSCPHCGFPFKRPIPPRINVPSKIGTYQISNPKVHNKIFFKLLVCVTAGILIFVCLVVTLFFIPPLSRSALPSKQEWIAKLSENNDVYRQTRTLLMKKEDFLTAMGNPGRSQIISGTQYWYFDCKDGTVQIEFSDDMVQATGLISGKVNEY